MGACHRGRGRGCASCVCCHVWTSCWARSAGRLRGTTNIVNCVVRGSAHFKRVIAHPACCHLAMGRLTKISRNADQASATCLHRGERRLIGEGVIGVGSYAGRNHVVGLPLGERPGPNRKPVNGNHHSQTLLHPPVSIITAPSRLSKSLI